MHTAQSPRSRSLPTAELGALARDRQRASSLRTKNLAVRAQDLPWVKPRPTAVNATDECPAESALLKQQAREALRTFNTTLLTRIVMRAQHRLFAKVTASYGSPHKSVNVPGRHDGMRLLRQDTVAFAMELIMSPVSMQKSAPGGEGSDWFGVTTLQNPVDAVTIATVLWELKPDLILEIGTECGGSALFMGQMLRLMRLDQGTHGKILTYDINPVVKRQCSSRARAHDSKLWRTLQHEGILETRLADVTAPDELAYIEKLASKAQSVLVIDDGDHTATPLIVHFELLSRFVTPGSYYLVQDTRLDRTCRAQIALNRDMKPQRRSWPYCNQIAGAKGGPARAVRYLQCASPSFSALNFAPDVSREPWVFTQHPGGWLKRRSPG